MSVALFWLLLLAVFGAIPLLLPRFIRLMTESESEKQTRKASERERRIAWVNATKSSLSDVLIRIAQITRSVASQIAVLLRQSLLVSGIISQKFRLVLESFRRFDPRWVTTITLRPRNIVAIIVCAACAFVFLKSVSFLGETATDFYQVLNSSERDPVWRGLAQLIGTFLLFFNLAITFVSAIGVRLSWSYLYKNK